MDKLLSVLSVLVLGALSLTAEPGGKFAWQTLQAEAAATNAAILPVSRTAGEPAAECVGRSGVKLTRSGDFVEFTVPVAANSLVVRYAIPDAPGGGGEEHTLGCYLGGGPRIDLKLSSRHTWLYGKETEPGNDPEELKKLPGSVARRFFDEVRILTPPMAAGTKIKLQKDAVDGAQWYIIDLVDVEQVAPPLPQPEGALSVRDYGAAGDGVSDDSEALRRCFDDAVKQGKTVYLAPGTYRTSRQFRVDEINIQGAGMWYSTILNRRDDLAAKSKGVGFHITGRSALRDFAIRGDATVRREETHLLWGTFGKDTLLENLWLEQGEAAVWVGRDKQPPAENLTVRNCRFRNLLADGINLCVGTQNSVVDNCHARGTGDDAFAMWSAPRGLSECRGNVIQNCTAEAPWRARCFAVFGGSDNRFENCRGSDTLTSAGLVASTQFEAYPFGGTTVFRNIVLERCGGFFFNNMPFGSILFWAENKDYSGQILLENITVRDGVTSGISVFGGQHKVQNIIVRDTVFDRPGQYGVDVFAGASGEIELQNVRFEHAPDPLLNNKSPDTFTVRGLDSGR